MKPHLQPFCLITVQCFSAAAAAANYNAQGVATIPPPPMNWQGTDVVFLFWKLVCNNYTLFTRRYRLSDGPTYGTPVWTILLGQIWSEQRKPKLIWASRSMEWRKSKETPSGYSRTHIGCDNKSTVGHLGFMANACMNCSLYWQQAHTVEFAKRPRSVTFAALLQRVNCFFA